VKRAEVPRKPPKEAEIRTVKSRHLRLNHRDQRHLSMSNTLRRNSTSSERHLSIHREQRRFSMSREPPPFSMPLPPPGLKDQLQLLAFKDPQRSHTFHNGHWSSPQPNSSNV
jgi:hypothetical protein